MQSLSSLFSLSNGMKMFLIISSNSQFAWELIYFWLWIFHYSLSIFTSRHHTKSCQISFLLISFGDLEISDDSHVFIKLLSWDQRWPSSSDYESEMINWMRTRCRGLTEELQKNINITQVFRGWNKKCLRYSAFSVNKQALSLYIIWLLIRVKPSLHNTVGTSFIWN